MGYANEMDIKTQTLIGPLAKKDYYSFKLKSSALNTQTLIEADGWVAWTSKSRPAGRWNDLFDLNYLHLGDIERKFGTTCSKFAMMAQMWRHKEYDYNLESRICYALLNAEIYFMCK